MNPAMKLRKVSFPRRPALLAVGVVALVGGVVGPASAANVRIDFATATPDWSCGKHLDSSTVELIFQCDGNLVLYRLRDGKALWASGTNGSGANDIDWSGRRGRIYIYKPGSGTPVCVLGPSDISDPTYAQYALVQDDANFVMYTNGKAVWSTHTAQYAQGTLHAC
jgi:hypothetical protein